jgi:hypothetical protein
VIIVTVQEKEVEAQMMINQIVTGVAEETIQRAKYHVGIVLRIVQNV